MLSFSVSRLQAKQEIGGNIAFRYTGTLDAIVKMIRYEGLPGFYKGMGTKIVQSVFAASVLFMVKEELVKAYVLIAHQSKRVLRNVMYSFLTCPLKGASHVGASIKLQSSPEKNIPC
ncbi:hypothetical protein AMTR_s00022p00098890 [Amborella trichopoda]|uniref:ADP/ATP translocase n=1 Tax=Amborella trichopoda TaxID=13333 RepID=W1PTV0_AMBTC|nr:hypothetical protein AMTR_s00022p00098890 [Amborella trichopoda]